MSNDLYNASGSPALASGGSSAVVRAEFDAVMAGFAKLPVFTANANKPIVVNSGATAMEPLGSTFALAGNFALTGTYAITLAAAGSVNTTLPAVSGTLFTTTGTVTLTNKTFASPAFAGITTGTYTIGGTPTYPSGTTLTSPVLSGNITGTYTIGGTPTFTSPTVAASTFTSPVFKKITVSSGPLTLTSGQMTFSSTPSIPSTGTQNKLYDYEEGTWTPTLSIEGYPTPGDPVLGDLTLAYTTQLGTYTKIGMVVHVSFVLVTSTFTHTTVPFAHWALYGLPFDVNQTLFGYQATYGTGALLCKGFTRSGKNSAYVAAAGINGIKGLLLWTMLDGNEDAATMLTLDHTSGTNVTIHGSATYIAKYGN